MIGTFQMEEPIEFSTKKGGQHLQSHKVNTCDALSHVSCAAGVLTA